jgi:hypothetical protein
MSASPYARRGHRGRAAGRGHLTKMVSRRTLPRCPRPDGAQVRAADTALALHQLKWPNSP